MTLSAVLSPFAVLEIAIDPLSTLSSTMSSSTFKDISLYVMGVGSQYPEHTVDADGFRQFAYKFYPKTPA